MLQYDYLFPVYNVFPNKLLALQNGMVAVDSIVPQ
jgi:hypothetical protein